MRVVFFGTPQVALPALDALVASSHEVVAVVSQPDRAKGRSGSPASPPVAGRAVARGIPLLQPESPKDEDFHAALRAFAPDACAVVAYGHLLPQAVLAIPPKGTINAHFSLLPRYRGAAPVQRAIMAGETQTGVCVFVLEPTLDTGPIVERVVVRIESDDTAGSLLERLGPIGATALVRALNAIESGTARPLPQDDVDATPAPKIRAEEAEIDWSLTADTIRNVIRGLNPSPGAFTLFRGRRVKIWAAALVPGSGDPGTILDPGEDFAVLTGEGALRPLEVQPEGKRRMSPEDFARGSRLTSDDRFGI